MDKESVINELCNKLRDYVESTADDEQDRQECLLSIAIVFLYSSLPEQYDREDLVDHTAFVISMLDEMVRADEDV